ncbi:uncharacterized protein LOC108734858 [Agrilus planipennis]|uniref:Uncharacterized protein LOC108734858 n=1 Tax=Agrilus planipennis TaxID=224129 RepID=A0A1W4WDN0_AGRPL|nr:uncharacterized protein LOC108734858 [Agrilus planipennis]
MNESFSLFLKLCYVYDILYFATAAFYSAIVLGQGKFPVGIYNGITDFQAPFVFEIVYTLQVLYIFFTLTFMAGYDLLLFVLAGHAYCEFRMLKKAFQDLPFEKGSKEEVTSKFNEYVDHHNEVIQYDN